MRTFEDLNITEREQAIKATSLAIIDDVANGILEIELMDEKNQQALRNIFANGISKDSSRLVKLMILNNRGIRNEIERLALAIASESDYDKEGKLLKEGSEYVDTLLN